jgi:hypothetical protein
LKSFSFSNDQWNKSKKRTVGHFLDLQINSILRLPCRSFVTALEEHYVITLKSGRNQVFSNCKIFKDFFLKR